MTILVDETIKPIVEDQVEIFQDRYDATIKVIEKSENEIIHSMVKNPHSVAILSRKLNENELKIFENKKIIPKITPFAVDAIALIINAKSKDTIIDLKEVMNFMKGTKNAHFNGIVFDNLNSSTFRYMDNLVGLKSIPEKGIFSFNTNNEVIEFISKNRGMIGIVGLNWLTQPTPDMLPAIDGVRILGVRGLKSSNYYNPTQNNIAEKKYPLCRDLYIINCQGYSGLGMGFASFVAGDIGQRIVLKSGLLPFKIPPRKINIVKQN